MNKYERIQDNIEELMSAIVVQAAKDYVVAYKSKDKPKIVSIERFFYSDRFRDLTHDKVSPDVVLKELRRQADDGTFLHQKRKGDAPKDERIQN